MEIILTEAAESISTLAEYLVGLNYKIVQYFPIHRIKNRPGRELFILRSFLLKDRFTLFKGSALQPVYNKIMQNKYPRRHMLYKFLIREEELTLEDLLVVFKREEIDNLVRSEIFDYKDGKYRSCFRIVPIDDMIIVSSPQYEFDTPKYVYIGEDSVVFYYLLKEEIKEKTNLALEIGCGTGLLSIWMSRFSKNVTSVDISKRALEFTNLNARINGVENIVTKQSDVYSGIEGKFDLIISNPPYVFLPEENIGRTFAYGGHLGIEILQKILLGLDNHLNENGTCYIIFFSYIKEDGTNTAYEMIEQTFNWKPYSVTLRQIDYYPIKYYPSFYKERKISHTIRYLIKVQKATEYKLDHIQIQGVNKVIQKAKIKL